MSSNTSEIVNWAADYKVRRTKNASNESIQHIRLDIGTGTDEQTVDGSNGLPVNIIGGSVEVDTTGLATEAKQDDIITAIEGISVTVDTTGLATDTKQDAQTALLTTIDTDTGNIATNTATIAGAVAGSEMQVDVVSSALPTGAATAAKQDDEINLLNSIDTHTSDTATLVNAINNKIATCNTANVTIGAALPAGNNNIGDVDIASLPAITGTVTANAGTNLNTSALALESGGNLAAIAASASVLDDWDESDRAKVNIIAGQAGVTAGAGSVAANTPRVTMASDSPDVTALQLLDDTIITDNGPFTDGTTKVSMAGYIYDEVAGTALTENDAAAARINVNRAQVGIIEDGVTRARYATVTASNALKVDGSAVTQPVSISGNQAVNVAQINGVTPLMGNGGSGTGAQRVTIANDSTGVLATVTTLTNITNWGNIVDNAQFTDGTTRLMPGGYIFDEVAGTALTENDAAAARIDSKRAQIGVIEDATTRGQRLGVSAIGGASVQGPQADDAAISASNNPVPQGGQAYTTTRSAVAANDVVTSAYDRYGRQAVVPFGPSASVVPFYFAYTGAGASQTALAAPGANLTNVILEMTIANGDAANATNMIFEQGSGGTDIRRLVIAANTTLQLTFPGGYAIGSNTALNMFNNSGSSTLYVSGTYITVAI